MLHREIERAKQPKQIKESVLYILTVLLKAEAKTLVIPAALSRVPGIFQRQAPEHTELL